MPARNVQSAITPPSRYVDALLWGGWRWQDADGGPVEITYTFSNESLAWRSWEKAALKQALSAWEAVADITFTLVSSPANANLIEVIAPNSEMEGNLGVHEPPEEGARNYGGFSRDGLGWTKAGLKPGGYGFVTLVHELGHGLGLAHPHDRGGGSPRFPGVRHDGDYGDHNLNQGIFTVMSYNDGWAKLQDPFGKGLVDHGYQMGPMAFDIAAIQELYGANSSHATGSNTYVLPKGNAPGTGWRSIWDTGGIDTIVHAGSARAVLDLRAATLGDSTIGGGAPSYAKGIFGGYTIANGVVIENAVGGRGSDKIRGNDADNMLTGRSGSDGIRGDDGNDTLKGGSGSDYLEGGAGSDRLTGGRGGDTLNGGAGEDTLIGGAGSDFLFGDSNFDRDRFVIQDGGGRDTIGNFEQGFDVIDISAFGFADLDAVRAASRNTAPGLEIKLDSNDTLVVRDLRLSSMTEDDFLL